MIDVKKLYFSYTEKPFVEDVSFHVGRGEIFGFLGPSGAGKSTIQKVLTGLNTKYKGSVKVAGIEIKERTNRFYENIGVDFEFSTCYEKFTARQNLAYFASLYEKQPRSIDELLHMVGLENDGDKKVADFSKGMRSRLNFIKALIHDPDILFLDEPTVGMDIQSRSAMWEMINKIQKEYHTTIFMTTHYLEEADMLSDTICIMNEGKTIIQGTPDELKNIIRKKLVRVDFTSSKDAKRFSSIVSEYFVSNVMDNSLSIDVNCIHKDLRFITKLLLDHGIPFKGIELVKPKLEDVFLNFLDKREVLS